jgi:hypothetical protein
MILFGLMSDQEELGKRPDSWFILFCFVTPDMEGRLRLGLCRQATGYDYAMENKYSFKLIWSHCRNAWIGLLLEVPICLLMHYVADGFWLSLVGWGPSPPITRDKYVSLTRTDLQQNRGDHFWLYGERKWQWNMIKRYSVSFLSLNGHWSSSHRIATRWPGQSTL